MKNKSKIRLITKNSTFIEKSLQSMTCWLVRRHTIKEFTFFSGEAKLKQLQKCHFNIVVRDYVITIRQNHLFFFWGGEDFSIIFLFTENKKNARASKEAKKK